MAITKVQDVGAVSNAATYPGATTAGNLLVARIGASADVTGVTDASGNTWVKATDLYNSGSAEAVDIWYVLSAAGGTPTVTAANGFGASFCHIHLAEYSSSGAWTLDQTAVFDTGGTPTTTFDSGATATTAQAEELLCGVEVNQSALNVTWTQPATELYDDATSGASRAMSVADEVTSSTGAYKATGTLPSSVGNWMAAIATFKSAAGGGVAGQPTMRRFGGVAPAAFRIGSEGVRGW